MTIKEVLTRIGYVRNYAKFSARELSLKMGMSEQYIAQVESGRIPLTSKKLLDILDICNFPIQRFFAENIAEYNEDNEFKNILKKIDPKQKELLIKFIESL